MVIWSFYWFIYLIFKLFSNLKIMKNRRHCHFNITMIHANYNSIFISGPSKNIFRTFFLLLKFGQSNIRPCIPFNGIKLNPNFIRILWVKYNYCIFQLLNLNFFFCFNLCKNLDTNVLDAMHPGVSPTVIAWICISQ